MSGGETGATDGTEENGAAAVDGNGTAEAERIGCGPLKVTLPGA
ncbi:hypothetical protein [Streptomyces sp. NPDC002722]